MARVFYGGIPTDIDIQKLRDRWPETELRAGETITHEEIQETLGVDVGANRFRTVLIRWRNIIERSTGKRLAYQESGTLKVLTETEKLTAIEHKRHSLIRQGRRNLVRAARVERSHLNEDEKRRLDHVTLVERNSIAAAQLRKQIEMPTM